MFLRTILTTTKSIKKNKYYNYKPNNQETYVDIEPDLIAAGLPNSKRAFFYSYGDGPARYMPSIDFLKSMKDHPRKLILHRSIERCYHKAKLQGKKYFALQDNGVCMATNDPNVIKRKKNVNPGL